MQIVSPVYRRPFTGDFGKFLQKGINLDENIEITFRTDFIPLGTFCFCDYSTGQIFIGNKGNSNINVTSVASSTIHQSLENKHENLMYMFSIADWIVENCNSENKYFFLSWIIVVWACSNRFFVMCNTRKTPWTVQTAHLDGLAVLFTNKILEIQPENIFFQRFKKISTASAHLPRYLLFETSSINSPHDKIAVECVNDLLEEIFEKSE
jgi:hypothetical protein